MTVLLPCFNAESTVGRSLDSLLMQEMKDFVCIVLDNCSTDASAGIIDQKTKSDSRFLVLKNTQNMGVAHSFHRLIRLSDSDFTIFLAADDWMHPSCLSLLLDGLARNPGAICAAPVTQRFRDDGFKMLSNGTSAICAKTTQARMQRYFSSLNDNSRFYGLYRTDVLKAGNIPLDFFAADLVLTCLTLRFGDHIEIGIHDGRSPLLFRELPISMRKYIPPSSSIFLILRLFIAPFAAGTKTLCLMLPKLQAALLLPRLIWLNFMLAFAVVRSFLGSSALLRRVYFSFLKSTHG